MPAYGFKCKKCGQEFELSLRIREMERGAKCPFCGSPETGRVYEPFYLKGGAGSSACSACSAASCDGYNLTDS
jgi:putative FmdB family regulatory protein